MPTDKRLNSYNKEMVRQVTKSIQLACPRKERMELVVEQIHASSKGSRLKWNQLLLAPGEEAS